MDRVEHEHDRVVLTRNGRAAAAIMSPEDLEALEDTLELLSDPTALEEIDRARQEVARGKVVTAEELFERGLPVPRARRRPDCRVLLGGPPGRRLVCRPPLPPPSRGDKLRVGSRG